MEQGYSTRLAQAHSHPLAATSWNQIYGHAFTVIGVAPKGFFGTKVGQDPALYLPIQLQSLLLPGRDLLHDPPGETRAEWINAIARLKPGVSLEQARAATNVLFHQTVLQQAAEAISSTDRADILTQTLPVSAIPTGLSSVRATTEDPLLALFALVGLILAIVVVNLAGMTSAQASGRQREVAMRLALGASRGRLLRQLLTESALLAFAGGVAGWVLGRYGAQVLIHRIGNQSPVELAIDWRVLAFTVAICAISALGFGLSPALRLSRLQLSRPARGARLQLGRATIVVQVGVALVLVTSAALFMRSLERLRQVDIGYNPHRLTRFYVNAINAGAAPQQALATYSRLESSLAQVPGVQAATFSANGLFRGSDSGDDITAEGYTGGRASTNWDAVAPGYFAAVGIPILLGRGFSPSDDTLSPQPVVIDKLLAQRYFAGRNPVGRLITLHETAGDLVTRVIGVAAVAQQQSLRAKPFPRMYMDILANRSFRYGVTFILRTYNNPGAQSIRAAATAVAPGLRLQNLSTLDASIDASIAPDLALSEVSGMFALLALIMAAMGLYAMLSYTVSRRQPEIGVRMALGAAPGEIRGMFLREAAALACIGLALGIGLATLAGRALGALLFQLSPTDPPSLGVAAAVLMGVTLAAAWLPALRASRLDPLATLRQE